MITQTQEDYIRAVYILKERKGEDPSVSDIANYLGLSRSTVWERLQTLAKIDLVNKENYLPVRLTEKGEEIAKNLIWKFRIIEVFLHDFLGLDLEQTYDEAHRLEHAFSDESVKRLSQKLNNPTVCPHGYDILQE